MIIKPTFVQNMYSDHPIGLGNGRRAILYSLQNGQCFWHQFGKCYYDGAPMLLKAPGQSQQRVSFDHLRELSNGGKDNMQNIVLAHRKCNQLRSVKSSARVLRDRLYNYFGIPLCDTKFLER